MEKLRAVTQESPQARAQELLHRAGDIYHEKVFSKISGPLGRVTDAIEPAISDAVLHTAAYKELFVVKRKIKSSNPELSSQFSSVNKTIMNARIISQGLFLLNAARSRVSEKLGIDEKEYDSQEEMKFVVQKLNERSEVAHLSFDEIVPLAYNAVTDFLEQVDGYRTESSKRVKKSVWAKTLRRRQGVIVLTSIQVGGEILAFSDKMPEVPAHEFAHGKGVIPEAQA